MPAFLARNESRLCTSLETRQWATCRYGPVYSTDTAGWGTPLAAYMTVPVVNDAGSGYSARQAYREKIYDDALARVQPGDIAILQWGRNDGEHFD